MTRLYLMDWESICYTVIGFLKKQPAIDIEAFLQTITPYYAQGKLGYESRYHGNPCKGAIEKTHAVAEGDFLRIDKQGQFSYISLSEKPFITRLW